MVRRAHKEVLATAIRQVPARFRRKILIRVDGVGAQLTGRIWHIPARLAVHARQRTLKISPSWPWKEAFLADDQISGPERSIWQAPNLATG